MTDAEFVEQALDIIERLLAGERAIVGVIERLSGDPCFIERKDRTVSDWLAQILQVLVSKADNWEQSTLEMRDGMEMYKNENAALRRMLWLRHGCDALYGDDGEMQCSRCGIDFRRLPPEDIERIWVRKARARAALEGK